jgi:putative DNA primase/helicase
VVDLRTGDLRENESRDDYVTKRCPIRYVPTAAAPRWEKLINEATGAPVPVDRDPSGNIDASTIGRYIPRPSLAEYIRRALGLSITGVIVDHVFFFAIGEGSNGKSLIFDTVKAILGPYAVSVPANLFMQPKYEQDAERPTAMAAMLAGARLVIASEVNDGQKLNTAAIKAHTGDSEMTARRMRENPFTFTQTHKVWMLTNVEPRLDHIDSAIRGRLHLAPFDRRWNRPGEVERNPTLPDGDKSLGTTLKLEAEGILTWLVRAAMAYREHGVKPAGRSHQHHAGLHQIARHARTLACNNGTLRSVLRYEGFGFVRAVCAMVWQ